MGGWPGPPLRASPEQGQACKGVLGPTMGVSGEDGLPLNQLPGWARALEGVHGSVSLWEEGKGFQLGS